MTNRKLSLTSRVSLPIVDNSDVLELAEVLMNTRLTSHQMTFLVSAMHSHVDSSLDGSNTVSMTVTVPTAAALLPPPPLPATATISPTAAAPTAVTPQVVLLYGGDPYHILSLNQAGLFYLVTKGKEPSVYAGWNNMSIQVIGVPGTVYQGVPSLAAGISLMNSTVAGDQAAQIVI